MVFHGVQTMDIQIQEVLDQSKDGQEGKVHNPKPRQKSMEQTLTEWAMQLIEKAPRPLLVPLAWAASHVVCMWNRSPFSHGWWVHFLVTITLSTIIPMVALITSWQETVEWVFRILLLLISGAGSLFTLVISWPKVKAVFKKKGILRKRK